MANLSNTSFGIGAMQGITQGIENAGDIYGMMENKKRGEILQARETRESKIQGAQIQDIEEANLPVKFDAIPGIQANPIRTNYVADTLKQNGWWNNGMPLGKHLRTATEISRTPEATKEIAIGTIDAINKQLLTMNKTSPDYTPLLERKTKIEKIYGMLENPKLKAVSDNKGGWQWFDENTKQIVPELKGMIPSEAEIAKITSAGADARAKEANATRIKAAEIGATSRETLAGKKKDLVTYIDRFNGARHVIDRKNPEHIAWLAQYGRQLTKEGEKGKGAGISLPGINPSIPSLPGSQIKKESYRDYLNVE